MLAERDARHPLALRLLSEVRAAVPDAPVAGPVDRDDVFAAYLDLMCLRIAVRPRRRRRPARYGRAPAGGTGGRAGARGRPAQPRPGAGGTGPGSRSRRCSPWGPAPARLGGGTGWASAVLAEGLLVPAGGGYRFAHEELADWIQGMHLDLDEPLRALVHRPGEPRGSRQPRPGAPPSRRPGRAGPPGPRPPARRPATVAAAAGSWWTPWTRDPGSWWAARLLARTLLEVPDAAPYTEVLRLLADRVVAWRRARRPVPADFRPAFWTALPVTDAERLDLLRRLVLADPAPPTAGDRYLDAVAGLLAAAPTDVQPLLTAWFADERPLPATPHATVATAAQALLHTHRHGALEELTETLAACAHPRADELLAVLAEEEPSAVCRAADRWAHDERPARRAAAVTSGLRAAPYVRTDADRELLRRTALALLARPADRPLHGGALALWSATRSPATGTRPAALRHLRRRRPAVPAERPGPGPDHASRTGPGRLPRPAARPDAGAAVRGPRRGHHPGPWPARQPRSPGKRRGCVRRPPGTSPPTSTAASPRAPPPAPSCCPSSPACSDGGPEPSWAALATVLAAPRHRRLPPASPGAAGGGCSRGRRTRPSWRPSCTRRWSGAGAGRGSPRGEPHRPALVRTPEGATRSDRGLVTSPGCPASPPA
ncbi:hypothetical protein LT493_18345 [Streptomyces tricolor]|nr:hypothetical protein [Streptomyces tricolor]